LEEDDGGYEEDDEFIQSSKWAEFTQALEDSETEKKMERMAQAFEKGFHAVKDEDECVACHAASCNEYQFVGVVMRDKGNKVKWYARKKANNSDWSVRMVHVDKAAVLHPNANGPSFSHEDWYGAESQAGVAACGVRP